MICQYVKCSTLACQALKVASQADEVRNRIKEFANLLRLFRASSAKKENRAQRGPVQFAGVGAPTITFQRGTAACICGCHLGGWGNRLASQHEDYARCARDAQRGALHVSHAKSVRGISEIYVVYMRTRCCDVACLHENETHRT